MSTKKYRVMKRFNSQKLVILFLLNASLVLGQKMSRDEVVQAALQNNQMIKSAEFQVEYFKQLKKTGTDIGKLSAVWMHGQYNSIYQDNNPIFFR